MKKTDLPVIPQSVQDILPSLDDEADDAQDNDDEDDIDEDEDMMADESGKLFGHVKHYLTTLGIYTYDFIDSRRG